MDVNTYWRTWDLQVLEKMKETKRISKICEDCGGFYLSEKNHPHQRFCSIRCKNRSQEKKLNNKEEKNGIQRNKSRTLDL